MKRFKHITQDPTADSIGSDQDLDTVQQLKAGLDELEQSIPVFTPGPQWFEQQVTDHRKTLRRRFIRDFGLFVLLALVVLTLSIAAYKEIPLLFLLVQLAAILMIPIYAVQKARKRVSE